MAYEMRISDWSSDVCSSDLSCEVETPCRSEGRLDFARRKRARGFHHFEATPTIPASIRCAISPDESDKRPLNISSLCCPLRGAGRGGWRSACGTVAKAPREEERRVGKEGVGTCGSRG